MRRESEWKKRRRGGGERETRRRGIKMKWKQDFLASPSSLLRFSCHALAMLLLSFILTTRSPSRMLAIFLLSLPSPSPSLSLTLSCLPVLWEDAVRLGSRCCRPDEARA